MTTFEITDHNTTYTVEAADEQAAVIAYAERTGLIVGRDFADAADLIEQNDLFIDRV